MVLEKLSNEIYEQEIDGIDEKEFKDIDLQNLIENFIINVYGNDIQTLIECEYEMRKPILKELGSDKFPGFYESIFHNSDEFIDYESDLFEELEGEGFENIKVVYEYDNWEEYKKDICTAFLTEYVQKIKEVLPSEITDENWFILEIANKDEDPLIISPKEYNFRTDKCYCDFKTNFKTLNAIKDYTLQNKNARQYIINHFTSCDGFISWISNNIQYWEELPIEQYEDRMLIALLDMLIALDDEEHIRNISISVIEDISAICYASPIITWNGKEYTEEEFKKIRGE